MNCLAIDDEPLALKVINDFCDRLDLLNLKASCTSPAEAIEVLNKHSVDLIFLDIHMPQLSGLDFLKTLSNPPLIIFTTGYPWYAVKGFELDAVDYLVKPILFDRFVKAVNKACKLKNLENRDYRYFSLDHRLMDTPDYLMIRVEYSVVKVNFNDILYIEGLKDYIKIHTVNKYLLTKSTMKRIEKKFPPEMFIRVHKSYIIPFAKIQKIDNNRVIIGEKHIPIGAQYKETLNNLLSKYCL